MEGGAEPVSVHAAICICTLGNEYIPKLQIRVIASAGSNPDQLSASEEVEEFIGINGEGRLSHASSLYRHSVSIPLSGVPIHYTGLVVAVRVLEVVLGNVFRP